MQKLISQIQTRLPTWQDKPISSTPLSGGITNRNFLVTVADGQFVVRVCAQGVAPLGIDRQIEEQCARIAGDAGLAPPLLAAFEVPDEGSGSEQVLITPYISGTTLSAAEIRAPDRLPRIAALLRQTHALPKFAGHFDLFEICARGLAFCRQHDAVLPVQIGEVERQLRRIQAGLGPPAHPLSACHNDLLAANWLEDKDGRIWLIDWEYAGWGDPFFDLGNLAANNEFGEQEDAALLTAYRGVITEADWARFQVMKVASDAREGIWSCVQTVLSSLEFDFVAYAEQHFERFLTGCDRAEFSLWLHE